MMLVALNKYLKISQLFTDMAPELQAAMIR